MILDLTSLRKAVASLERAIRVSSTQAEYQSGSDQEEVVRAGVIQNFEFTYEICWKFIKRWLKINFNDPAIDGMSRKELFRLAAESRLISNVEDWFFYHKARNETTHTYNIEIAKSIYLTAIRFVGDARVLLQVLESKND
ncbi:MAG: nucleotidyltransferase substrate binding protein [bacterium]